MVIPENLPRRKCLYPRSDRFLKDFHDLRDTGIARVLRDTNLFQWRLSLPTEELCGAACRSQIAFADFVALVPSLGQQPPLSNVVTMVISPENVPSQIIEEIGRVDRKNIDPRHPDALAATSIPPHCCCE